jgi:hypothetical protein
MSSYNQGKQQGYNGGHGKYSATGFIPSRNAPTIQQDRESGCLSSLLTIGIIVLIVSMSFYFIV